MMRSWPAASAARRSAAQRLAAIRVRHMSGPAVAPPGATAATLPGWYAQSVSQGVLEHSDAQAALLVRLEGVREAVAASRKRAAAADWLVGLSDALREAARSDTTAAVRRSLGRGSSATGRRGMVSAAAQATVNSGAGTELSAAAASEAFVVSFLKARAALMGAGARSATRLRRAVATPEGVYLHGGVGTGKTMCVDAFAALCAADGAGEAGAVGANLARWTQDEASALLKHAARPQGVGGVRRVHHHALLMEVHERMHAWLQGPASSAGAVAAVASDVAAGRGIDGSGSGSPVRLLCCDELQVYDAADAALLGQVFTALVERGVCIVVTSNRAPTDLFANGLNTDLVKPLVRAVQATCAVVDMDSEHSADSAASLRDSQSDRVGLAPAGASGPSSAASKALPDFRRRLAAPAGTIVWAAGPGADAEGASEAGVRSRFEDIAAAVRAAGSSDRSGALHGKGASMAASGRLRVGRDNAGLFCAELDVGFGRKLALPEVANDRCLWAPFEWLCGQAAALGPADFRSIMRAFDVVAVPGVPALGFQERNEARRFITAVDVAYEEGVVLLAGLQTHPDALFAGLAETSFRAVGASSENEQAGDPRANPPRTKVVRHGGSSSSAATTFVAGPGDEQVEWSATGRVGASLGEATGVADTAFAHRRTASRLLELAGADFVSSLASRRGFRLD